VTWQHIERAAVIVPILDPIGHAIGGWLKVHVPPVAAGWTFAFILVLAIYGLLLRKVW
jgi:hypothetical protein